MEAADPKQPPPLFFSRYLSTHLRATYIISTPALVAVRHSLPHEGFAPTDQPLDTHSFITPSPFASCSGGSRISTARPGSLCLCLCLAGRGFSHDIKTGAKRRTSKLRESRRLLAPFAHAFGERSELSRRLQPAAAEPASRWLGLADVPIDLDFLVTIWYCPKGFNTAPQKYAHALRPVLRRRRTILLRHRAAVRLHLLQFFPF